jgi:hypothetical protein
VAVGEVSVRWSAVWEKKDKRREAGGARRVKGRG